MCQYMHTGPGCDNALISFSELCMTSWRFLSSTGRHDSIQHESLQCLGTKYCEVQWHSSSNYFPARCGVALKDKATAPSISSWNIYWKWSIPSGTAWFLNRWNRETDKMTYEQFGSVNVPDTRLINLICIRLINLICINFLLSGQFYLQNLQRLLLKNWKAIVI